MSKITDLLIFSLQEFGRSSSRSGSHSVHHQTSTPGFMGDRDMLYTASNTFTLPFFPIILLFYFHQYDFWGQPGSIISNSWAICLAPRYHVHLAPVEEMSSSLHGVPSTLQNVSDNSSDHVIIIKILYHVCCLHKVGKTCWVPCHIGLLDSEATSVADEVAALHRSLVSDQSSQHWCLCLASSCCFIFISKWMDKCSW